MKIPYRLMAAGALASALLLAPTAKADASGYCVITAWKTQNTAVIASESSEPHEMRPVVCVPIWTEKLNVVDSEVGNKVSCSTEAHGRRYLGSYKITGYDTCASCCGKTDGITASGTQATVGRTCAASADLPFGTRLWIEGIGERVVEDRGGAIKGSRIDVLCEDHPACYAVTGTYEVYILED